MTGNNTAPFVMGALMGPMMLAMLHGQLSGANGGGWTAIIVFLTAHLVIGAVAVAGVLFAARLSPKWKARRVRLHRPSLRHFGIMLGSATFSALIIHLFVHGGL